MNTQFYVILAFVTLVGAEAWYVRRSGYPLNSSISNMSCGVLNLCTSVFAAIIFALLYLWVETTARLIDGLGWQWWNVILTFVLIDLSYYAYHRASHRIALLWGAHIVHHESDEYNLTVSLRQGAVSPFTSMCFYLLPAAVGVPLVVFLAVNGIYQLYQFFVHSALVTHMGWLEHVLVTPRLHRLHHARNEQYIDCNYSGFLLLWDKLFGSYRPPSVQPVYGVTEPLSSWSPVWANIGYFQDLFGRARKRRGWDRLWTFVGPPEWQPIEESPEPQTQYVPYNARPEAGVHTVAIAWFCVGTILAFVLTALPRDWDLTTRTGIALAAAISVWFSTRLFDGLKVREQ